jgi:hypothetical protein
MNDNLESIFTLIENWQNIGDINIREYFYNIEKIFTRYKCDIAYINDVNILKIDLKNISERTTNYGILSSYYGMTISSKEIDFCSSEYNDLLENNYKEKDLFTKQFIYNLKYLADFIEDCISTINKRINELDPLPNIILTGFDCKLKNIDEIHSKMVAKNFIISDLNDFKAIFNNELVKNVKPIIWLVKSEKGRKPGQSSQVALRVFLTLMLGNITAETERKIPYFIKDEKGNEMKINKPKPNELKVYGFETFFY